MDGEKENYADSALINFIEQELKDRTNGRKAFIKFLDSVFVLSVSDKELSLASRMHAVESLLSGSTLERIDLWNQERVIMLVDYLRKKYSKELRDWIFQPGRLDLDPGRVEQVEVEVKKALRLRIE